MRLLVESAVQIYLCYYVKKCIIKKMSTLKDEITEMIHHLPDDTTVEDIQYHLYVLEKIRKGRECFKSGRGMSHQQAKERLAKWLTS